MRTITNTVNFEDSRTAPRGPAVTMTGNAPGTERFRIKWTEEGYAHREAEALFNRTDLVNLIAALFGADGPGIEGGFDALAKIGLASETPSGGSGLTGAGKARGPMPPDPQRYELTGVGHEILQTLVNETGLKPDMPFPMTAARAAVDLLRKCRTKPGLEICRGESVDFVLLDAIGAGWVAREPVQDDAPRSVHYQLTPEGHSMLCAIDAWDKFARSREPKQS